jgi:hypothetical protein
MLVLYREPPKTAKSVLARAIKDIMVALQRNVGLVPLDHFVAIKFQQHAQQILGRLIFLIQLKIAHATKASTEAMYRALNALLVHLQ